MRHPGEPRSRRLIRNVIILNSRSVITTIMGIIGTSLCLHAMGVENYGIYAALWGLVSLLGFLDTSLRSASERYYAVALTSPDPALTESTFRCIRRILLWITLFTAIVAEAAGIPIVVYALRLPPEKMASIIWTYQMTVVTLLAGIIAIPYHSLLVASERIDVIARAQIIMAAYTLGGIACLHLLADTLVGYGALIASAALITNTVWYLEAARHYARHRKQTTGNTRTVPVAGTSTFIRFALWNGLGEASVTVCHQGLNLLLNLFFGPVANAARSIAFQIQTFAAKLFDNFRLPMSPQLIMAYSENPTDVSTGSRILPLLQASSLTGTALMITFGVPVCFSCKGLLHVWLGDDVPPDAVVFSCLLIAGMIIDATSFFSEVLIKATGNVRVYYRTASLVLLACLPVATVCLLLGSPAWSAPAAYVASQCALTAYRATYLQALGIHARFFRSILMPALAGVTVSAAICTLTTLLIPSDGFLPTLLSTLIAMVLSGAALYRVMVPPLARQRLNAFFRRP